MNKEAFSTEAKRDIEKLLKLQNSKYLEQSKSAWLQELSRNNGPFACIEDGVPKLKIYSYYTGRGFDGEVELTQERYESLNVPVEHHNKISIKQAVKLEIEKMKKIPKELEEYEGIERANSRVTDSGYVLREVFEIDQATPIETVKSFFFHRIPSEFSVSIDGGENKEFKWENRTEGLELVKKNYKKKPTKIYTTSY